MPPQGFGLRGDEQQQQAHAAAQIEDDAASNASSDYHEPHGFVEKMEYRYKRIMSWIDENRTLFDFVAYSFFLVVFTVVATEANPGTDLIEQV